MRKFALKNSKKSRILFDYGHIILAFISLIALLFTFGIATSGFYFNTKLLTFTFIVISYLATYAILHTFRKEQFIEIEEKVKERVSNNIFDSEIDEKLLVLEEAGKYFGASLKSVDMFRLLSSRIGEIIPYTTCAFFLIDETDKFFVPFAAGKNSRLLESINFDCREAIAGRAWLSRQVVCEKNLAPNRNGTDEEYLNGLNSAIAIPLFRADEVFCILVLYSDKENNFGTEDKILTEAVGERITPLIMGSFSFEKSLSNALTDKLTNLPNERAFYLVLENQVAEAQRFFEQRTLTVLAIDILDFAEINQRYGHTTGDKILAFSADLMKNQLRQMDLLSRTVNDEFLVVLPTATDQITEFIIKRIEHRFKTEPFMISENEKYFVELNFGAATFQRDGETAGQLINTARLRKRQSKSDGQNSVIFFPKQYVN